MNTHEYQAKQILKKYKIPIPEFRIVKNETEIDEALASLSTDVAVVKVQVHAGGRGKAGGVKVGTSRDKIKELAQGMLGMKIVNNQTGAEGIVAHQVMITPAVDIEKEYYIGCTIDRERARAILIASPEGGVDIEEVAAKTPHRILTLPIDLCVGLRNYQLVELVKFMGWEKDVAKQGKQIALGLAKAFLDCDASTLEINPLVLTNNDQLFALDAKLSIDDNALFRQKDLALFYDPTQVKSSESRAKEFDLAYVPLTGTIGCMVNGAGLAMATMDMIFHYGGAPANFLDVGGGASVEKVTEGFKIILEDPNVKAILVNIFGGIMNCATIAEGIIAAATAVKPQIPIIVRLEGTNVKEGRKMIQRSTFDIITADDLEDAAKKVIQAVK
ncbi:MAG: ADP-forming succinate--CoA ligase subunit beta [Simkaniaceae bacterium]|nr:ADP-forming succinate--CoA ligase subunit beta [Simkaniaceae bacterium]MCF7852362.1 ADP-forming succinate--CoA ligase subunit beta [Simkaniaceae bacterium]